MTVLTSTSRPSSIVNKLVLGYPDQATVYNIMLMSVSLVLVVVGETMSYFCLVCHLDSHIILLIFALFSLFTQQPLVKFKRYSLVQSPYGASSHQMTGRLYQ